MILIGNGRIGGALLGRAAAYNSSARMVSRTEGWEVLDEPAGELIFVSVRTTDLEAVLPRIPIHRREDVILIQNGMLSPWLAEKGWDSATRGVLYFAVPKRGAPIDVGEPSPFSGPRAEEMVAWLEALEIGAKVVSEKQFQSIEVEKLLWNCVFGLLCGVTKQPVGLLCNEQSETIHAMTEELISVAARRRGVELDAYKVVPEMVAYSHSIANYVGRVSDWSFRNGWFVQSAEELGIDMPCHSSWQARYEQLSAE